MIPTFQLRYIKNYILKPEGQNPPKILSYGLRPELCEDLWSKLCVYYIYVCVLYTWVLQFYMVQWIGLRENLQETMVFTIKYRGFL